MLSEEAYAWSSQQYITDGVAAGVDPTVLENAVDQIEKVIIPYPDLPAILTLNHLATRLGVSYVRLRTIVSGAQDCYHHFRIRKRSGGQRLISIPEPMLKKTQRWIAEYILNPQPVHHCSFAFKPGSSITACAARHAGSRWLIKMDVAGFFGSITEIQVYRVFHELGYQPLVAFELARLTTHAPPNNPKYRLSKNWQARSHTSPISSYHSERLGYLPQGAPTSPMLSNLIMRAADAEIEAIAKATGVHYTRYSDDLTFSTRGDFERRKAVRLVHETSKILRRMGLQINPKKTTIVPPGARKVVLGLLVDGTTPRLPPTFRSTLRQHLYYLERLGPLEHAKRREFDSVWGMYRHIRGLIDFAHMIEPGYAEAMLARLHAVKWINHPSDAL